jgi:hypothetical protein
VLVRITIDWFNQQFQVLDARCQILIRLSTLRQSRRQVCLGVGIGIVARVQADPAAGMIFRQLSFTPSEDGANEHVCIKDQRLAGRTFSRAAKLFEFRDELFFVPIGENFRETFGGGSEFGLDSGRCGPSGRAHIDARGLTAPGDVNRRLGCKIASNLLPEFADNDFDRRQKASLRPHQCTPQGGPDGTYSKAEARNQL